MSKDNSQDQLVNLQAAQLAAQVAQQAAALEFQKQRFTMLEMPQFQAQTDIDRQRLQEEMDRLAFDKATEAYKDALQEATLTGTYQGKPTIDWLTQQAQITGVLNGQETLQGKLNDAQIAQMQHAMELDSKNFELNYQKYGTDLQHWTSEFQETQTNDLRNYLLQEAGVTGQFNGQDTLDKQKMDSQNALSYLNLLASVQNDPFKALRVQQNAGSFNNLAQGFLGKYQMAGAGGVTGNPGQTQVSDYLHPIGLDGQPVQGQQPLAQPMVPAGVPATVPATATAQPMTDPTTGQVLAALPAYMYQAPGVAQPGAVPVASQTPPVAQTGAVGATGVEQPASVATTAYTYSPPGAQAPVDAYNYQPTNTGSMQMYPPGVAAPSTQAQYSTTTPQSVDAQNKLMQPGALGTQGTTSSQSTGVLTPDKVNAENYANADAGQQKTLWQYFGDQGWDPDTAKDVFMKSLPRYGGPSRGTVKQAA